MTSSRTVLIESNRLFREGLKHLLAGTHFAVEMEFSTTESALAHKDGAMVSGLVITGEVSTEAGDLHRLRDIYPDLCSSRHQMAGAKVLSVFASTIRRTWPKETVRAAADRWKC